MHIQSLGLEDPWEESLATHSSIVTWRISWTEEPGGIQSMGSQRDTTEQLRTRTCVHARTHTHTHLEVTHHVQRPRKADSVKGIP